MAWFNKHKYTYFHTTLFVFFACLLLQIAAAPLHAMQQPKEILQTESVQKPKWFRVYCGVVSFFTRPAGKLLQKTVDTIEEKVPNLVEIAANSDSWAWFCESVLGVKEPVGHESCDTLYDGVDDQKYSQPLVTLKSPANFSQGLIYVLLGFVVLASVAPTVQAVRPWDVNPNNYDICHDQDNGTILCVRLSRKGIAYSDSALAPDGQCWSAIPGSVPSMSTCINTLDSGKIEMCLFTPDNTNAPYLCKSAIMNGLPSNIYSQDSSGNFIKGGLSNIGSTLAGHAGSLMGGVFESSSLAKDIQQFKTDDGTCIIYLNLFPQTSLFPTEVKELAKKLRVAEPASLDFSCNQALCKFIKEKDSALTRITNEPMRGFIAHVLAHYKYSPMTGAVPIIVYRYPAHNDNTWSTTLWTGLSGIIGMVIGAKGFGNQINPVKVVMGGVIASVGSRIVDYYFWYFFSSGRVVSYPFFSMSPPSLTISAEGVDLLESINAETIADRFAALATGKPEELARGYALLVNMQSERSGERIYVSPQTKPLDLSKELVVNPNPLMVRPTDDAHIVAPLLEQKEEICRMTRELEDAQNASGGMTNFKVRPSRLFDC